MIKTKSPSFQLYMMLQRDNNNIERRITQKRNKKMESYMYRKTSLAVAAFEAVFMVSNSFKS